MALLFSPWGVTSNSPAHLRLECFPRLQATKQLRQGASPEGRAQKQRQVWGKQTRQRQGRFPRAGCTVGLQADSFGVEVAKLAGLPSSVVNRARQILKELEEEGGKTYVKAAAEPEDQMNMLDLRAQQVQQALEAITVETLTPIEALNELYKLQMLLN